MNRIILIGNGFDLAHGLPTSYDSFINNLWLSIYKEVRNDLDYHVTNNEYVSVKVRDRIHLLRDYLPVYDSNRTHKEIISFLNNSELSLTYHNNFFQLICSHCQEGGWHGVEHDYYQVLKSLKKTPNLNTQVKEFNNQFSKIEKDLQQYLIDVEKKTVISDDVISEITEKIYLSFKFEDVSITYRKRLIESLFQYITLVFSNFVTPSVDSVIPIIKQRFLVLSGYDNIQLFQILEGFFYRKTLDEQVKYIESKRSIKQVFIDILYPEKFLLLDFNYTNTTVKYNHPDTDIIHIHGELNNPKNPMIFGYGDEIGEDYKKIEDLEENELLKNVKSIRYQDTNNYQRLMEFIESDYYQVFVMGHSCGNSDRTLLNTLFEHENCLSIKPYYYQFGENAEDSNYSDIVRNISRNFRDKPAMRNKVVNKTYCEPLLGYKKK